MIPLATLLFLSAIGFGLARWLRLPVLPILMVTGIAGAWLADGLGQTFDQKFSRQVIELGLAFLLFSAGIELNPRRFAHQTRAVFWIASIQFVLAGLIGYLVSRLLGYDGLTSLYLGFAVSASSTLVVLRQLKSRQQMFQPFGRIVTGVLLLQDLAMIFVVVLLIHLPGGMHEILRGFGALTVLAVLAILGHYLLLPRLILFFRAQEEILLLMALAILFGFLGLAYFLDVPVVAGAFLAGFSLSAFPVNGLLRGLLGSLSDFFQAIFFVALGVMIAFSGFAVLPHALLLSFLILFITPPIVAAVAEWQGSSPRAGIESGLLLAQTSEFALVLALAGTTAGHLSMEVFGMIALIAVITMTWTPFVATDRVAWRLLHLHPLWLRSDTRARMKDHILMLGFGSSGMWLAKPLLDAGREILVVDDDPQVIRQLVQSRIPCLRGDASDEKILQRAGAGQARMILTAVPRVGDVLKILRHAKKTPVMARVSEAAEAEAVRKAGGIPVLNAEPAAQAFIDWFTRTFK